MRGKIGKKLPDGRPDGSGSETGLAPLTTNVDDFLLIYDTAGDNRTQLFMASEFPALPNWRMDNNLGSLQFLQFGGVGSATGVTIADGGNVGIGTTTPGAPLHVVDTTPGPGSHAIIADEGIFCYIARAPLRSASASPTVPVFGTTSTAPSAPSSCVTRPAAPRPSRFFPAARITSWC